MSVALPLQLNALGSHTLFYSENSSQCFSHGLGMSKRARIFRENSCRLACKGIVLDVSELFFPIIQRDVV